jgi:prepilin-type processing-associated H-X9-DG protein
MYADDYDECLAPYSHGMGYAGSLGYAGADGPRWADEVLPYIKNQQIYDCPGGTQRVAVLAGGYYLDIRTYSYGLSTASQWGPEFGVGGRALAEIEDAAGTILLAEDGRQDDTADAESIGRIIPNAADALGDLCGRVNGMRHTGADLGDYAAHAMNAAYVDGHAKWVRLGDTYLTHWTIAAD